MRDWLYANGWNNLFLDLDPQQGIRAGERWQEALKSAAERCEAVIFLISPEWAASKWCLAEFLLAKNLNKRLIGVVIKSTPFEDLPTEMTSEWQVTDLTISPLSVTFDVTLPGGDQTTTVAFSGDGLERLKLGLQSAGLDASYFAWPPEGDPDRPPYRGLMPLEAEDAGIFFGRDSSIVEAIDRLRGLREVMPPRLVVILGASGAGKSSFLRAGLLPRLARDDRHFLPLPVIRPERAAIAGETGLVASLTAALRERGPVKNRAAVRTAVASGFSTLRPLLEELVQTAHQKTAGADAPGKPPSLIVPIDQGEELYLAEGAGEADRFLTILSDLLREDNPAAIVLLTIRSDAYERLQLDQKLEGVRQHTLGLAPMPRGAYVDVITGPPRRLEGTSRALRIEEHLTDALLRDIEDGGGKDALPLLAFTLERLYAEYGDDGDLTLSEYEALGRIKGSIETAIERALEAADADPAVPKDRKARLALLRRGLIPWLAGIDPDTGSPRRRVARLSEIPVEARPLIEHLIEQRLLATDVSSETGEVTIEPAHEALLRQWGLLEGWLEEDFEALTTLEGVKRAARDWQSNGEDAAWLVHSGGRLEAAERVASRDDFARHLEDVERTYLSAARVSENTRLAREHRTRRTLVFGSFVASAVLLLLCAFAGWNWYRAEEERRQAAIQRDEALRAESLFLADLAIRELDNNDAVTGMLLAIEGLQDSRAESQTQRRRPHVPQSESSLATALSARRESVVLDLNGGHPQQSEANVHFFSNLGQYLDGRIGRVVRAAFSPDGTRIVTAFRDSTARLWEASTGTQVAVLRGHENFVGHAAFSPDSTLIVTASADRTARVWNVSTGAKVAVLEGHEKWVHGAAFSPDGTRIITTSVDRTARIWDVLTGAEVAVLGEPEWQVDYAAFSPDGTHIVTTYEDGTARVWNVSTGAEVAFLRGAEDFIRHAAFSPDSARIVTALSDGTAQVWNVSTGEEAVTLRGHDSFLRHAAYSPDGTLIVTASDDGTARVWNALTGASVAVLRGHGDFFVAGSLFAGRRLHRHRIP